MEKVLCAFSSNYRPLYIGDIYKVLSMPSGYIVHFRYKKKYIDPQILSQSKEYIGKEIIIFFTDTNKQTYEATNYSVRSAKLTLLEYTNETELVHIYMELNNFVDVTIDPSTGISELPTNKFFTELNCTISNKNQSWKTKIDQLKDFFPNLSFFYLKKIKGTYGLKKKLKSRSNKKGSYYNFIHGKKYLIDISLANPNENKCKVSLSPSTDDVSFNISNPISITAHYDDLTIPMFLKSLNVSSESSYLSFYPEISEEHVPDEFVNEYTSNIEIVKSVSKLNSLKFGLATVITVMSIWSIKDNSSSLNILSSDLSIDWKFVISCIFLVLASSYLFFKFNRK
jgi:hypothetical protein